jgi:hypothetical protein
MLSPSNAFKAEMSEASMPLTNAVAPAWGAILGVIVVSLGVLILPEFANPQKGGQRTDWFSMGMAIVTIVVVPTSLVLPEWVAQWWAPGEDAAVQRWFMIQRHRFKTLAILAALNVVAWGLEHRWWSWAFAGVIFSIMFVGFPTRQKFEHYLEAEHFSHSNSTALH